MENLPNDLFTFSTLQKAWLKYQTSVSEQLNKVLILKGEMTLEGTIIHLSVNNLIQQQTLNLFKEELMQFLRTELKNFSITLDSSIKREGQVGRQMYTSQEKFNHLAKKHPILNKLKIEFGLEVNF